MTAGLRAAIYLELGLAIPLLATVLHFRRVRGTDRESRAVLRYFRAFFVLVLTIPVALIALGTGRSLAALAPLGWTFGRSGLGIVLTLAGLPFTILAGLIGSRDTAMQGMYPLAKAACAGPRTFFAYELSYFGLYYIPWESAYRGLLFLPFVPALGLVPALAVQTALSALLHIGHPRSEIAAAAGAGITFGLVAYATGSFVYPLLLHASTGIATDSLLYRRHRKGLL